MRDAALANAGPRGAPSWQSVLQAGGGAGGDRRWADRQQQRRDGGGDVAGSYDGHDDEQLFAGQPGSDSADFHDSGHNYSEEQWPREQQQLGGATPAA